MLPLQLLPGPAGSLLAVGHATDLLGPSPAMERVAQGHSVLDQAARAASGEFHLARHDLDAWTFRGAQMLGQYGTHPLRVRRFREERRGRAPGRRVHPQSPARTKSFA